MALLEVKGLKKHFPVTGGVLLRQVGTVYALDGVSITLEKGQTLGVVGESGCGKTTLGRCIMGLYPPTEGSVSVNGQDIFSLTASRKKQMSLVLQMIFQDPFESLNPRQTVKEILEEKYIIHHKRKPDMTGEILGLMQRVGLSRDSLNKFPHEFSGGQRQRIGIARAISLEPSLIICDEPVSALDVSVQSKILNLLLDLQATMDLSYLLISHDLSVVKHVSDRIAVMYLGKIVESASARTIYENGCHPYTKALLSAVPIPDPESVKKRIPLEGEVPSVEHPPPGCRFHTRCPHVQEICRTQEPLLRENETEPDHQTACHFFY